MADDLFRSPQRRLVVDAVTKRLQDGPAPIALRALARELGVGHSTAERAMSEMRTVGMIERRRVPWTQPGEGFRGYVYRLIECEAPGEAPGWLSGIPVLTEPLSGVSHRDEHRGLVGEAPGALLAPFVSSTTSSKGVCTTTRDQHHDRAMRLLAKLEAKHHVAITGKGRATLIEALREDELGVSECYREAVTTSTTNLIGLLIRKLQAGEHRGKRRACQHHGHVHPSVRKRPGGLHLCDSCWSSVERVTVMNLNDTNHFVEEAMH